MKFITMICLLCITVASSRDLQQGATRVETSTSGPGSQARGSASAEVSFGGTDTPTARTSTPQSLDVYLLVDGSASMATALRTMRNDARDFVRDLFRLSRNVRVGVGRYRATTSDVPFRNILSLSGNQSAVINAITNGWGVYGNRSPRAQLYALRRVANDGGIGYRQNSQKIVVWLGDTRGGNPALRVTEANAIRALQNRGLQVAATNVGSLNSNGQATRITEATDGVLQSFSADGSPVATGSRAPDGGTATASGFGPGTVVRTRAVSGQTTSSSNSGITLPDAVIESVQELL